MPRRGEMGKIQNGNRFEVLGRAKEGFKGADSRAEREAGPVQFEKDKDDPFGIDSLIGEASAKAGANEEKGKGKKRYGLEQAEDRDRDERDARRKRARVDDD